MKKIAIIKIQESYLNYDHELVVERVTEFQEVDDETYGILVNAQHANNFRIIEYPANPEEFILKTVTDYKNKILREEKKRQQEIEDANKAKLARALKRKAANEKKEKELLAELVRKHGVPDADSKAKK